MALAAKQPALWGFVAQLDGVENEKDTLPQASPQPVVVVKPV
jgi:hypothetical protein